MKMGYDMSGWGDAWYFDCSTVLQQLLVVPFLFYSGYGVMEQYKKKGHAYVASIPRRRLLCTWLNFAIAVCCFAVVHLAFRTGMPVRRMLVALTCFDEIGNLNWYIFAILWCYAATWLGMLVLPRLKLGNERLCLFVLGGAVAYFVLMNVVFPQERWWYDTIFAYALGVVVSTYGERIFAFVKRHYPACLLTVSVAFAVLYAIGYETYDLRQYEKLMSMGRGVSALYAIQHNLASCCFMLLILFGTMKLRLGNAFLAWCGRHVFPIYMYHLLFFLIAGCLLPKPITTCTAHLVIVGAFILTLVTAKFYPYWEIKR